MISQRQWIDVARTMVPHGTMSRSIPICAPAAAVQARHSSRPVPVVRLHHPAPRVPWQGLTAGSHAAAPSSPREPRDGRTAWMGHGLDGHNRPGAGIRSTDTDAKGKRQGRGQGQQSWVEHGPEVWKEGDQRDGRQGPKQRMCRTEPRPKQPKTRRGWNPKRVVARSRTAQFGTSKPNTARRCSTPNSCHK